MDLLNMRDNIIFNYRKIRGLRGVGGQEVVKSFGQGLHLKTGLNLSENFFEIPGSGSLPFL